MRPQQYALPSGRRQRKSIAEGGRLQYKQDDALVRATQYSVFENCRLDRLAVLQGRKNG